jgi:chromosome segregation ATPase
MADLAQRLEETDARLTQRMADLAQRLEETDTRLTRRLEESEARLTQRVETLLETQAAFAAQQQRHNEAIAAIHEEEFRFRVGLRELLTAQVLQQENLAKLSTNMDKLTEAQRRMEERVSEMAGKVDALVAVVDGLIRREPPQA